MEIKLIPLMADISEPFLLDDHLACIGRAAPPLNQLPSERLQQLSRSHARIFREEGDLYLVDLGSRNGTYLNGQKLQDQPVVVKDGDELRFGNLAFKVEDRGVAPALEQDQEAPVFLELCHRGGDQRAQILVTEFPWLVGKHEDAIVQFATQENVTIPFLSRRHAHFFLVDDSIYIEDLGSTNGTFVNGERLSGDSHKIQHGDLIQFGKKNEMAFSVVLHETVADDDRTEIIDYDSEQPDQSELEPHTVLVDKANTFLEIFCDDMEDEADPEQPSEDESEAAPASPKKKSVAGAWLNLFFGQSESGSDAPSKNKWIVAVVVILLVGVGVGGYGYWSQTPLVKAKKLAESGKFQRSAQIAAAAVAAGEDSQELENLAVSAAIQWLLPKWQQAIDSGDFNEADSIAQQFASEFSSNPELDAISYLLSWTGRLEQAVGGAEAKSKNDLYTATPLLKQLQSDWKDNKAACRKAINILTQEYPAFSETHNTLSSQLRFISSNEPSLEAITELDQQLKRGIDEGDVEQLRFALAEFIGNYPALLKGTKLQSDIGLYADLLNARDAHQFAQLTTNLASKPFRTRVFISYAEPALTAELPDQSYIDRYLSAETAWASGNLVEAIDIMTLLESENRSGLAGQTLASYNEIITRYGVLLDISDVELSNNESLKQQLVELYQMLDPEKDRYIYKKLEPKFKQLQLTGRIDTERKLIRAHELWSRYQSLGGIKNLMRFEDRVSTQFTARAKELTEAQSLFSAAIKEADSAGVSISKQDLELASLVSREIKRQREAIEEARSVLGDKVTTRKLALLDL